LRLRYYPFLASLDDFAIRNLGFRVTLRMLASDESIASTALSVIESSASGDYKIREPSSTEEAVLSFYLALGAAKLLGASALESVASYYASLASRAMEYEDDKSLLAIARRLGVEIENASLSIPWSVGRDGSIRVKIYNYSVRLPSFLRFAATRTPPGLELQNQMLLGGNVYLDKRLLILLLREAVRDLIYARARELDPSEIADTEFALRAREAYERAMRRRRGVKWDPNALPPCVENSLNSIASGSASGDQLYLAATFIGALSLTAMEIADALKLQEDDVRVRGLVNLSKIAASKGFAPYTCEEAKRRGLCPLANDCRGPDPLREYFRRLRLSKYPPG
jgi:DNA primase large subunit